MRRCRPWLGTLVEIEADEAAAIEAGFHAVERIHRLMSAHEPDSELSRLNRGQRVALSPDTRAVMDRALFWFRASNGLFDPAVAGRRAIARGALPLHPGQARPEADLTALAFAGDMAWLERPACLDLGGIAKGHAIDAAAAAMRAAGARRGLVNAGGDLFAFGGPQAVDVVDPKSRSPRLRILLDGRALATSAGLAKGQGLDFGHLPGNRWASVSVEAACAIDADALTKIAIAGHPRTAELLDLADARAVAIAHDGMVVELGIRAAA